MVNSTKKGRRQTSGLRFSRRPLHSRLVRTLLHLGCLCVAVIFFCGNLAGAETNAPAFDLDKSAACIERMKQLLQTVADLETTALSSNETARADCIRDKHVKIIGLLDLSNESQSRLHSPPPEGVTPADEAAYSEILLACARAEKVAAEAGACLNIETKKLKQPRDAERPEKKPGETAKRKPVRLARQRKVAVRNEQTCVHQDRLAALLVAAMDLRITDTNAPNANITALTKLAIEPLDGWQPNDCADLDDLCVVAARALNLKVEKPGDPASYEQALREDGLPVDTLLPARIPAAPPPLLLESEVRSFFLTGYAAPLPSSKRLLPD